MEVATSTGLIKFRINSNKQNLSTKFSVSLYTWKQKRLQINGKSHEIKTVTF